MTDEQAERMLVAVNETVERSRKTEGIAGSVSNIDEALSVIIALERRFDFTSAVIMRDDVNDQYVQMWEAEGEEPKDLTDEQWETFKNGYFWRKAAEELMWEGVPEAIRADLIDEGLAPPTAVI